MTKQSDQAFYPDDFGQPTIVEQLRAEIAALEQDNERLKAAMCELVRALDAEAVATLKSERMRDNEGAFDEAEIAAADDKTVDAICTAGEALNAARRALEGQVK